MNPRNKGMAMQMQSEQLLQLALFVILIAATKTEPILMSKPNCQTKCGSVTIPFPFGMNKECSLNPSFLITCNRTSRNTHTPFWDSHYNQNVQVLSISLDGELRVSLPVVRECYNNRTDNFVHEPDTVGYVLTPFQLSPNRNMLTVVGVDTAGYVLPFTDTDEQEHRYNASICLSLYRANLVESGSCSGFGCCETTIRQGLPVFNYYTSMTILSSSYYNKLFGSDPCSYAFLVEDGAYNFNSIDLFKFNHSTPFPVVLDWAVGNHTCKEAMKDASTYACKSDNSTCLDANWGTGYLCNCSLGYYGNPYLYGGCHGVFPSLGSIILLLGLWRLYKVVRQKIIQERKEKFFKQNGGLLLKQRLSSGEVNVDKVKLFSLRDLEKATDHFNVNRILGKGGQGTVYKGMLTDGKIVAVKKFKVEGNVEEFINEFLILSQINHRNVVKLLGSCLETEIPLLVYEFISNGNLYEYLHEQNEELLMTWDMRLRIATEIAGALFYLHSAASLPIYHRDIKSTNILLDEKYRAKVADFGTSRMVSIEATHLTTVVQGTFGYLDPEYFHTSQFTEKSDVYSFGVVLVELLTGQKPISSLRPQEAKSLAPYFILCMEENRLFDIIDERVMREGKKEHVIAVANLASRCLELNGKKRPTMKEITLELEGIQKFERKSDIQENNDELELARIEDYQSWATCSMTLNNKAPTLEDMPIRWTT